MQREMVKDESGFNSDGQETRDRMHGGRRPHDSAPADNLTLNRAAVEYAKRGIPVFQVKPGAKDPLSAHGFKDATTDIAEVTKLWALSPGANIGMATDDLVVLDVDVKADGTDGRETLFQILGTRDPLKVTPLVQQTPSGGYHLFFRRNGMTIRNRARDIGPGLDTRGVTKNGRPAGYVVLAPSIVSTGGGPKAYSWLASTALDDLGSVPAMPRKLAFLATFNKREREVIASDRELQAKIDDAEPAEWLAVFEGHLPRSYSASTDQTQSTPYRHPYIQAVIEGECEDIASAAFGSQEDTFNTASFRVGARLKQFGLGAHADEAIDRLMTAGAEMANERGKRPWTASELREKARRGVLDGLERGMFQPKSLERSTVPLPPDFEAELAQLASLHPVLYDQQRKAISKKLGVRTETLDGLVVERRREAEAKAKGGDGFEDEEPWPEPVEGRQLYRRLVQTLKTYAILPPLSAEAIALWVMHAHALDAATHSPILVLSSPEKRCGKTTVAKIVAALTPKGQHTANITPAVLFRVIEAHRPTLVIDEADTFFDLQDELRGIVNGGHDRETAYVWRVEGEGSERKPERFSVWSPKVIALIGHLPDTIEDRSIRVPLRRKLPSERTARLPAELRKAFADLRQQTAKWAADNMDLLRAADPQLPDELNDRAGDNWRPLLAIADILQGSHASGARDVAMKLSAGADEDDTRTALLKDIRKLFSEDNKRDIPVHLLLTQLNQMSEAPWGEFRDGKGLSARGLAKMLKPFEIRSHETKNHNSYRRSDFGDAFGRYLDGGEIFGEPIPNAD